jgi:hypothetical protein
MVDQQLSISPLGEHQDNTDGSVNYSSCNGSLCHEIGQYNMRLWIELRLNLVVATDASILGSILPQSSQPSTEEVSQNNTSTSSHHASLKPS